MTTAARLRTLLERYVPGPVLDELLEADAADGLVARRVDVTVLTCDLRGFTALSEHRPPDEVLRTLNRFFDEMVAVVLDRGGVPISFVGDALWAAFGLPRPGQSDADNAVAAARDMAGRVAKVNAEGGFEGAELRIGTAVHSGEVIAGNVGATSRFDYSIIGDTVNATARLEKANKVLGTDVLVSAETVARLNSPGGLVDRGEVYVHGKGHALRVYTFAAESGAHEPGPPGTSHAHVRGARVLVVDDDPVMRRLFQAQLSRHGYDVLSVGDGESALQMMEAWAPELALLDIVMPDVSGFDVLERRRSMPGIAEIPVIVVSGQEDQASAIRGLDLGAVDFVHKPPRPPELLARVRNAVVLRRQREETRRLVTIFEKLVATDPVTGLPGPEAFAAFWAGERLRAQAGAYQVTLLLLAVETAGEGGPAPDEVVARVGRALTRSLRPEDLVARLAPDRFAVCLPQTGLVAAHELAERAKGAAAAVPGGEGVSLRAGLANSREWDWDELPGAAEAGLAVPEAWRLAE